MFIFSVWNRYPLYTVIVNQKKSSPVLLIGPHIFWHVNHIVSHWNNQETYVYDDEFSINKSNSRLSVLEDKLCSSASNMWHHQFFFCCNFPHTASAFLRHLLQVELSICSQTDGVPSHVALSLSRMGEGQQAESGQILVQTQGTWAEWTLRVGNGARWWLLTFHKYAATDKAQTLSQSHWSVKQLSMKSGGINFDVVCILMCCFPFTANDLISPIKRHLELFLVWPLGYPLSSPYISSYGNITYFSLCGY